MAYPHERCLVELADDRLRRATRQEEDGEQLALQNPQNPAHEHSPDLASRHMLSSTGSDFVVVTFLSKEGLMDSKRTNRRELLKGGAALAGLFTTKDDAVCTGTCK